jgi:hypothetical protein
MHPKLDQDLSSLWYDLTSSASFAGLNKLHSAAKKQKLPYTKAEVKAWLLAQPSYAINYPKRYKFKRNKTLSYGINWLWQMDLAHTPDLKFASRNHVWLLVCVDVFSRKLFVRPMKNKSGQTVAQNLRDIFVTDRCSLAQTDEGLEFYNKHVTQVFQEFNVAHYSVNSVMKASLCERAIRTLKSRIYKYITKYGNKRSYLEDLPMIVESINNTKHGSHGFAPNEVTLENQELVFEKLYPNFYKQRKRVPLLKIGDKVRISKLRQVFAKGYRATYTKDVFTVSAVLSTRDPPVYRLKDADDTDILGVFYANELLKVPDEKTS